MQPGSGGYLEAVPLTSFVAMSLAATGRVSHPVTRAARTFLRDSVRDDGSWPIDTNLATWTTSLAVNALACDPTVTAEVANLQWLLHCQHRRRHPFTGADPGGWGWTDLSGAVPDADDTPSALLACARWPGSAHWPPEVQAEVRSAAAAGVHWLLDLQNRDGGWPTFCRGWGKLPFDRSGADLTAHAIRRWPPGARSPHVESTAHCGAAGPIWTARSAAMAAGCRFGLATRTIRRKKTRCMALRVSCWHMANWGGPNAMPRNAEPPGWPRYNTQMVVGGVVSTRTKSRATR